MSAFDKIFGGAGSKLVKNDGSEVDVSTLKGKTIGIYFSAHWCGPCRGFTPQLVKFYNMMKETGRNFEVVFASSDRDKAGFDEYFGEMPWLAFPFGDERKAKNSQLFGVEGIPTFVLVDDNGALITKDGRRGVMSDPQGADFPWKPPTMDEACSGLTFQAHDGSKVTWDDLKKKTAVAFYFSAHWCGPCRAFTPQLIKTYNKVKADGKEFEIVFVSSDRDNASFEEYWGTMPWIALPLSNTAGKAKLEEVFPHRGIPTLYIVDPAKGKVITDSGRGKVMGDKEGANFPWTPLPCERLGDGPDVNRTAILSLLLDDAEDVDAANASQKALIEFATAKKKEWRGGKVEEDDDADYPVDFGYGDEDTGIVAPIRQFCGLTKKAPVLFILDVPKGKKYMWSGTGYPGAKDFEAMVAGYVAGTLPSVSIKTPVA